MRIRANDEVVVIKGAYKGTKGKVSKALPRENKVIVQGVNERKKHIKPDASNPEGRIVTIYAPIDVSNVALVDPKTGAATKVGYRVEDGRKVRYAKKSGETIK